MGLGTLCDHAASHFPVREVVRMWIKRVFRILRFLLLTAIVLYLCTINVR